jgi:hypothetical protein
MKNNMKRLTFLCLVSLVGCSPGIQNIAGYSHPLFETPISANDSIRPAIQVDILDASEHWLGTAELYLAVQSSRFPDQTWVVLPLNRGEFDGATKRFVQLPFEVRKGDTIAFNLLDCDSLSSSQEDLIIGGCKAAGYCIFRAGKAYQPVVANILKPGINATADAVATVILNECKMHQFDNFGVAEYVVPNELPKTPSLANRLTILEEERYARVQLKLYGQAE